MALPNAAVDEMAAYQHDCNLKKAAEEPDYGLSSERLAALSH